MSSPARTPASSPPPVCLIFPPLVESNFGSLYPAPAVLAAYLAEHGIASMQEDLNEQFAEFLLDPPMLSALGGGEMARVEPDSLAAAAARWSSRNRGRLLDEAGRHHFGPDSSHGFLLEILAQPFSVDPDPSVLGGVDVDSELSRFYLQAFEWSGIVGRLAASTRLIGVSVAMGPQLVPALVLTNLLKAHLPDARIVLGGPAISLMADQDIDTMLAAQPSVDCAVRFDGELPLLELAKQAVGGEWDPAAVPGVSVWQADKGHHRPPSPGPGLNELPYPCYPRDALDRLANPTLSITQARGCYWGKCDYCDFVELYGGSAPFRGRHPDRFTDEVERMVADFGVRRFNFVTESIPPAFARRMSAQFLDRGIDVSWNSFAMVDRRFDRELLALMVEAGCEFLVIGLETMITRVLKLVHKSADRAENFRFLRDARATGMRLRINLIPDLPSTTYAESLAALADMEELTDCFESVSVFPFEATRSSNVGRNPSQFGLIQLDASGVKGQSQYALNHLHNVDPGMTDEERADVHRRYRQFANRINAGGPAEVPLSHVVSGPHSSVRLPVEELDVYDTGDSLVCTHIGTRERIALPRPVAQSLRAHRRGEPFTPADMAARLGDTNASTLIRKLVAARVLVAARQAGEADGD